MFIKKYDAVLLNATRSFLFSIRDLYFCDLTAFRRFARRKHIQSDAGMNLAFFKFDRIIGRTIFIANTLLIKKTLKNVSCEYDRWV